MSDPVSTIRNLGPASNETFARAGITSAQQLRDLGPDQAYALLLASGSKPHFIMYYAMVMGLQGRPWNDCQGEEKAGLRKRFDTLKMQAAKNGKGDSAIEAALDEIGVIARK